MTRSSIFIATLFVLSEGLESSGVTAWAGQQLIARAGTARNRLLIALMALAAVMAALVTPNGAAAALLPVVVLAARRSRQSTSQMLMPLAFAASAGALLVLSGSTGQRHRVRRAVRVHGGAVRVLRVRAHRAPAGRW